MRSREFKFVLKSFENCRPLHCESPKSCKTVFKIGIIITFQHAIVQTPYGHRRQLRDAVSLFQQKLPCYGVARGKSFSLLERQSKNRRITPSENLLLFRVLPQGSKEIVTFSKFSNLHTFRTLHAFYLFDRPCLKIYDDENI